MNNEISSELYIKRIKELEGQILKPVPEKVVEDYPYWRAVHLGAVALNIMEHSRVFKARNSFDIISFTSHDEALSIATDLAKTFRDANKSQFGAQQYFRFQQLTNLGEQFHFPTLVHSLKDSSKLEHLVFDESGPGVTYNGTLTVNMIDPYSRDVLRKIFDNKIV
ncbi:hypothetical protein H0X09_03130 [Candidatus Saccharibacteria bacterium]|nr:hypothetical protein [Candidatus Saccharibacteria bacterium]